MDNLNEALIKIQADITSAAESLRQAATVEETSLTTQIREVLVGIGGIHTQCEAERLELEQDILALMQGEQVALLERRRLQAEVTQLEADVVRLTAALLAASQPPIVDPPIVDPPIVDPPIVDPPGNSTTGSWALQHVNLSTEEMKDIRPPGWDARRAALEARVRSSRYLAFGQGASIELLNLDMVGPEYTYIQKQVSVGWGDVTKQGADFTASNLTFKSENLATATGLKWFMRLYNLHNVVFEDIIAEGQMGVNGRVSPIEHGWYFNCSGDSTQQFCLVRDFGGKPFYFAHREFPYPGYSRGDNAPYTRKTIHVIDSCVSIDNDQDASKGSFAATFFDCGSVRFPAKIHIKNCVFASKWSFVRSSSNNTRLPIGDLNSSPENIQSCGALMVTSYQQTGATHPVDEVLIENTVFSHFGNKKNPLIVIRNAKVVHLKGCVLNTHSGLSTIDIGSDGRWMGDQLFPEKLILEDCDSATNMTFRMWSPDGTFTTTQAKSLGALVEIVRPQLA